MRIAGGFNSEKIKIVCGICRKKILKSGQNQKYCKDCFYINKNKISKKWLKSHKDKVKKHQHKYKSSEKGKKTANDGTRRFRQTLKGKLNDIKNRRKYRCAKMNIIENFSILDINKILLNSKGICNGYHREPHYVGNENLDIDHIYPVSLAYKDFLKTRIKRIYNITDIQLLCKSCNSKKRDKVI